MDKPEGWHDCVTFRFIFMYVMQKLRTLIVKATFH